MIQAILEAREYSVSSVTKPNKIDIAFYVAPIINGLIRFGTMEEKEEFLLLYHIMILMKLQLELGEESQS